MSNKLPDIGTIASLSHCSGLSRPTIHRAIRSGHLRVARVGRRVLIHKADALAWLQAPAVEEAE